MHTHTNYRFKVQLRVVSITVQSNPELDDQTNTTPHVRSVVGETGTQRIKRGCGCGCGCAVRVRGAGARCGCAGAGAGAGAGAWVRVSKCSLLSPAISGPSSDAITTPHASSVVGETGTPQIRCRCVGA